MSTRPVLFEFNCHRDPNNRTLSYTHSLPSSLIIKNPHASPTYQSDFISAIRPILVQHAPACQAASELACEICNSPTTQVLQTPMSYLHVLETPLVHSLVTAVCGKMACEVEARRGIQEVVGEGVAGAGYGMGSGPGTTEVLACKVCGKVEGSRKCAGCGVVAYCGRECQRRDWQVHKGACRAGK